MILLFSIFFIASCSSVRPGKLAGKCYLSSDWTYKYPKLYVEFYGDSTFLYKIPHVYDITGRWRMSGDTVILFSPDLKISHINVFEGDTVLEPWIITMCNKYTDLDGNIDAYIIERDTLYPVMKDGVKRSDFLYAIPKEGPNSYIYHLSTYPGPKKDK